VVLDEGGSIEGRVVDHKGSPLRGIELVALLDNGAMDFGGAPPTREASMHRLGLAGGMGAGSARSEADGKFLFERLPEGPFSIVARAPGFEPAAVGPLKPGDRADLILLAQARLSGDVLDAETRLPVAGFGLKLSPTEASDEDRALESGDRLTLDPAHGSFLYTDLPPGDYVLLVHAEGYAPFRGAVKLGPGEAGSVAVVLDHGLRVSGVVRSSSTRAPIAGAEIVAVPGAEEERRIRPRARSDEDGRFLLQGLAAGEYELVVAHPDFIQADEDRTRKVTVPLDAEKDLELRLDPAGRLEGRVTNLPALVSQETEELHVVLLTRLPDEERPDDAASNVRPEKSRWALPLDSSGRYSAVSLRPGTYRLELIKQGGREATFSLKMTLAGQEPLEPGKLLGETEVRAGETARLDAAVR
jgi:carboxypeptidase family protein